MEKGTAGINLIAYTLCFILSACGFSLFAYSPLLYTIEAYFAFGSVTNEHVSSISAELLGDAISQVDMHTTKDSPSARNIAVFIEELSRAVPHFIFANRASIIPLLGCKSYSIRNAIITSLGTLHYVN